VHHGFVEVKNEKMSKSLHNFLTARDCFRLAEPEALRAMMLNAHYRAPLGIEWSTNGDGVVDACPQLDEAERRVEYIYRTHVRLAAIPESRVVDAGEVPDELSGFAQRFLHALDDDLNMPLALAAAAELLKAVNDLAERAKTKKGQVPRAALHAARENLGLLGRVLGLGNDDPAAFLARVRQRRAARLGLREDEVERKIAERVAARNARDFARADAIRDEIASRGIELMDGPEGTTWRIP
jgi:cysteinyl-tRNA synthetase